VGGDDARVGVDGRSGERRHGTSSSGGVGQLGGVVGDPGAVVGAESDSDSDKEDRFG
jgi:hypothetical protein